MNCARLFGELTNVHLLGPKGADEVPHYMRHLDVGMGLYNPEFSSWLDGDSMKLHEYLAAGLPTVSTPFHANLNADFDGLLELAAGVDEFEQAIARVLVRSMVARADWERRCETFLDSNTWDCRASEAVELVRKSHSGPPLA
jgi:hypothetical protein